MHVISFMARHGSMPLLDHNVASPVAENCNQDLFVPDPAAGRCQDRVPGNCRRDKGALLSVLVFRSSINAHAIALIVPSPA